MKSDREKKIEAVCHEREFYGRDGEHYDKYYLRIQDRVGNLMEILRERGNTIAPGTRQNINKAIMQNLKRIDNICDNINRQLTQRKELNRLRSMRKNERK